MSGLSNTSLSSSDCICATDPDCQRPSALYGWEQISNVSVFTMNYIIEGSIDGCFALDSFLLSTLQCFYSNSDCLSIVMNYLNQTYFHLTTNISWFTPKSLIYDPLTTRFPPNSSLSIITKEMMIEQWNINSSFEDYYSSCKPNYCSYSSKSYEYNSIGVIIKMVSMIGGLIVALRLITPQIVTFILRFFEPKIKQQGGGEGKHFYIFEINMTLHLFEIVRPKLFNRIKMFYKNLIKFLYNELINLTIFPQYTFGTNLNRSEVKRLNRLSTRLYIILLIIGFIILSIHTLIHPEILTETINKPSLNVYKSLFDNHNDTLECSCSLISSTYDQYIQIEPKFPSGKFQIKIPISIVISDLFELLYI